MTRLLPLLVAALLCWALGCYELLWFVPVALFMPPLFSTCTIFTDDFSTDQLATAYHTSAGTWAVGSGVLTCTTASALLRCETAVTAGLTGIYASMTAVCATTSDIARLVIGYSDDSNYWFVEVQPGATNGTLKIYQRSGGVNTQQGSTQTFTGFTTSQTAVVCCSYFNGAVNAVGTISGVNKSSVTVAATITAAGSKAGLGTGAGSSSVTFDNFLLSKHNVDDSTCQNCIACLGCNSDNIPAEMQISVTGVANMGICGGCTQWNGTYVLSSSNCNCTNDGAYPPSDCPFNNNECRWMYSSSLSSVQCTGDPKQTYCMAFLATKTGANYSIGWTAIVDVLNGQAGVLGESFGGTQPQCHLFNGETMSPGFGASVNCDFSAASATATAL